MKNGFCDLYAGFKEIISGALLITSFGIIGFPFSSQSQSLEKDDFPDQLEIHDTFSADENKGTLLDVSNQMDLMNRIRQKTAMEDATSPTDAIDEALKALDSMQIEDSLKQ